MNRGNRVSQYFSAETFVHPSISSVQIIDNLKDETKTFKSEYNKYEQQRGIQTQRSNYEIRQEFWSKSETSLENARKNYYRSHCYPGSCQPKPLSSVLDETYDTADIDTSDITSDSIFRSVSNQHIPSEIPGHLSPSKQKSLEVYRNFSNSDFNHKDLMTLHFVYSNSEYDSARDTTNVHGNHLQYFSETSLENRNNPHAIQPTKSQLEDVEKNFECPSQPLQRCDNMSYLTLNKDTFRRNKSNQCLQNDLNKQPVCYYFDLETNTEDYRVRANYKENNGFTSQNKITRQTLDYYEESEDTPPTYRTQSKVSSSEMFHGNSEEGYGNFGQNQQHLQENDSFYKKYSTKSKSNRNILSQHSIVYEFGQVSGRKITNESNDNIVLKEVNTRNNAENYYNTWTKSDHESQGLSENEYYTSNDVLNHETFTQTQMNPTFFKNVPIVQNSTHNKKSNNMGFPSRDRTTEGKGFERKICRLNWDYQNQRKYVPASHQDVDNNNTRNLFHGQGQNENQRVENTIFFEEVAQNTLESDMTFVSNDHIRHSSESNLTNFNTSDYEHLSQSVSKCKIHQKHASSVQRDDITYQETGKDFENNRAFAKDKPQCYSQWSLRYAMKEDETLNKSFSKAEGQQISSKYSSRSFVKLSSASSMHTENEHTANSCEASELFEQSSNIRTEKKFLQNAFSLVDPRYNASAFVCNQDTNIGHDDNISLPRNEHNGLNMSTHARESFKQRLSQCESRNINRTKNVIVLFDNKDRFNEVERVELEKPMLKHVLLKQVSIKEYFKKTLYQLATINLSKADIESELRQLYQRRIHYKQCVKEEYTILIPRRLHPKLITYFIPFVEI